MRIHGDKLEQHADLRQALTFPQRLVVDRQGRAYVGDFRLRRFERRESQTRVGNLVHTRRTSSSSSRAISVRQMARWSPPTAGWWWRRVTRNTPGEFPDPSRMASLDETAIHTALEGSPDGICLDAEGAIWVALFDKDRFDRVLNGKVGRDHRNSGPSRDRLQLGGADGRTLFCLTYKGALGDIGKSVASQVEIATVDAPSAGSP